MAKAQFTVTQVPGSSRTSEGRIYTHAIIRRFDAAAFAAGLDARLVGCDNKTERSNFEHYKTIVTNGLGGKWTNKAWCGPIDQAMLDSANKAITANGVTWAEWLASKQQAERLATAKVLADDTGAFNVCQWSMSEANARKALNSWASAYHCDVQVVLVKRVK